MFSPSDFDVTIRPDTQYATVYMIGHGCEERPVASITRRRFGETGPAFRVYMNGVHIGATDGTKYSQSFTRQVRGIVADAMATLADTFAAFARSAHNAAYANAPRETLDEMFDDGLGG